MDLVSSEPTGASVWGHCRVLFRLMESGLLRACCRFNFWTLWRSVQADRRYGHHRSHVFSALGHFGVQFRQMDSGLLKAQWSFSIQALWHSVQADRRWVNKGPTWFQFWDIVGFILGGWNLISSGPNCASVLEHCGVQFRLMDYGLFRTSWGFSSGTFLGLLQADRRCVTTEPM